MFEKAIHSAMPLIGLFSMAIGFRLMFRYIFDIYDGLSYTDLESELELYRYFSCTQYTSQK